MQTLAFMQHMQGANLADRARLDADMGMVKSKSPSAFEPAMRKAEIRNKPNAPAKENKQRTRAEDLAGAAVATPSRGNAGENVTSGSSASSSSSSAPIQDVAHAAGSAQEQPVNSTQLEKSLNAALQAVEQGAQNSEAGKELQALLRNTLQMLEQGSSAQNETLATQLQNSLGTEGLQKLQDMLIAHTVATASDTTSMQLSQEGKAAMAQIQALLEQALRQGEHSANLESEWGTKVGQPEVVEGFVLHSDDAKNAKTTGKVDDPRFAELLNKPADLSSLREQQKQQAGRGVSLSTDTPASEFSALERTQGQSGVAVAVETTETQTTSANFTAVAAGTSTGNGSGGLVEVMNSGFSAGTKADGIQGNNTAPGTDPSIITLKSGATMPMARVVDQTIQHLNLHARGDSSIVTVRLHPEELGELNIRMVMEGDQLKLQIQAQNQQVREILEQNFPRLRSAMEEQGVTVEDFHVSLGNSDAEDQARSHSGDDFSQRNRAVAAGLQADRDADTLDLAQPNRTVAAGAGGLSVHV
ncbi:MAG: flagellar hook-length control protein FliK [Desulfuromonadaceae bacterium]|nr:flagellar hook-length control protein FliK [Desulfuromonadaceae bacterium]